MSDLPLIHCTIGVTAHNEEQNIARLLTSLLTQDLIHVAIDGVVVVASGCTDRTVEIVQAIARKEPLVSLFVQEKREGKTSAINVFLQHASSEICVLESADTLPRSDSIEKLV